MPSGPALGPYSSGRSQAAFRRGYYEDAPQETFHRGIVRDSARHALPPGAVYNAIDFLLEQPGKAYKRGGWDRHSLILGASASVAAVATLHIPTRVVAVGDDGTLYDVTGESSAQADSIGACWSPGENPPLYVNRLVFCDPGNSGIPKQVRWDSGGSAIVVESLFAAPAGMPHAAHSIVHNGIVVLGRDAGLENRVWFWPDPDLEPLVDPAEVFVDMSHEVSGFASCSGLLLTFSPVSVERVLGTIPYGRSGANMETQPLGNVGCLDARSIVHVDESVVFAGQEGVWITNGSAISSLMQGTVQSYWRTLFPRRTIRQITAGLLGRDFLIVTVLGASSNNLIDSLLYHFPTRCWTRLGNVGARMYAQGRDEEEALETYAASNAAGYVNRLASMLAPDSSHMSDGDGTAVQPTMELVFGDAGSVKAFQQGRVVHQITVGTSTAWAAAHVYAVNDLVLGIDRVFKITARTGDFKSGLTQPDWASVSSVGGTIVDNHVTWTLIGPNLDVTVATGLIPGAFTESVRLSATTGARRAVFSPLVSDNAHSTLALSVRLTQTGPSAVTEVYGVDVDLRPLIPSYQGEDG